MKLRADSDSGKLTFLVFTALRTTKRAETELVATKLAERQQKHQDREAINLKQSKEGNKKKPKQAHILIVMPHDKSP